MIMAVASLEIVHCNPSNQSVPFWDQGMIRQQKERDGLHLSYAVPPNSGLPAFMALWLLCYGKHLPFTWLVNSTAG